MPKPKNVQLCGVHFEISSKVGVLYAIQTLHSVGFFESVCLKIYTAFICALDSVVNRYTAEKRRIILFSRQWPNGEASTAVIAGSSSVVDSFTAQLFSDNLRNVCKPAARL